MTNEQKASILEKFPFIQFDQHFEDTLNYVFNSDKNLFLQGRAGGGKSQIIKIISALMKNVIVLSTTGITAVELSTEQMPAKTLHSFFWIPPDVLYTQQDLYQLQPKNNRLLNQAELIVIDEVSMMSNNLFDFVCEKIKFHRKDHTVPRMILFGDVMQLPPVVPMSNQLVADYFTDKYDGNVMFFNSIWFNDLDFKTLFLRKSYRQTEQMFSDKLLQIGYRDHTQETLDYFNQRIMPLPHFEKQHKNYVYMSPTNDAVNLVNNKYMTKLTGKLATYKAEMSSGFPTDKRPAADTVDIREGAQVMCIVNNYEAGYVNGTIGEVMQVHKDYIIIDSGGVMKKVGRTRYEIFDLAVDGNNIVRKSVGWFKQIDAKICKAATVHRLQGKSLDAAYFCLQNWTPEGLVYVGLSRLRTIDGLGLNRPLTDKDIKINEEAFQFLEG
jgi:ATP-dependent exoDNAse (exonuclease V) alpha subunit